MGTSTPSTIAFFKVMDKSKYLLKSNPVICSPENIINNLCLGFVGFFFIYVFNTLYTEFIKRRLPVMSSR